jgi:acyl-CoA dehydrogenase
MLGPRADFRRGRCSLFGPAAVNIAAPDEGDVHMLAHIADADQKEQFLASLARGEKR